MKDKKDVMKEDISFLNQLVISLEQAELKLEEAYKKQNYSQFQSIKEFILKLQKKIDEFVEDGKR